MRCAVLERKKITACFLKRNESLEHERRERGLWVEVASLTPRTWLTSNLIGLITVCMRAGFQAFQVKPDFGPSSGCSLYLALGISYLSPIWGFEISKLAPCFFAYLSKLLLGVLKKDGHGNDVR